MNPQPIRAAYHQDNAIGRPCPQCDAGPGQWCVTPRGRLRRVPCVLRTRESAPLTPIVSRGRSKHRRTHTGGGDNEAAL